MDEYNYIVLEYMEAYFGKDNIIECVAHLDEGGLPHLHMDIVQITKDGKLSSKKLITRDFILSVHNELSKILKMNGFDVERAKNKEQSKSGRSAKQYNYQLEYGNYQKAQMIVSQLAR